MPDKVYHMAHQINAIIGYMPYLIAGWGDMGSHEHAVSQRCGTGANTAHGASATRNAAAERADMAVGRTARLEYDSHQQHVRILKNTYSAPVFRSFLSG